METHEDDPTTNSQPDSWTAFHEQLGDLGDRLKHTYEKVAAEGSPSEEDVKDAIGTLIGAWDRVADSVTTALQDPEVRQHLKNAASSFAVAVGNTISELGDELRETNDGPPKHTHQHTSEEE